VEPECRWRVTLSCRDDAPFSDRDDPEHVSEVDRALARVARGHRDAGPFLGLHHEQHGPEASIVVNVTAADATAAEEVVRTLFLEELPAWISVVSVEVRPLPEPDIEAAHSPAECTCSFCGKSQQMVKRLIICRGAIICDECVELCAEILDEELAPTPGAP